MKRAVELKHAYIHRKRGVCGGRPVIRGTRFPVSAVVEYVYRLGMTPEEMVREWKHLSLAQIHDALSYYHDHKDEIDQSIRRNNESILRKKMIG